jgi:hypothetical protein
MARSSGNAFFANFSTYDAPFPDKGPPGAGQQLEEGTHPLRLLRELRPAGLLTAGRGGPVRVPTTTDTRTTTASTADGLSRTAAGAMRAH